MAVRIPDGLGAQSEIAALQQRWVATEQEVIRLRQESADLRRLLRDVMKLRQEEEQPSTQPLGKRLAALAKAKGIKRLVGELGISERSYHRIQAGGGSEKLRERVKDYLKREEVPFTRSFSNRILEISHRMP
jgi:hypothetical protein